MANPRYRACNITTVYGWTSPEAALDDGAAMTWFEWRARATTYRRGRRATDTLFAADDDDTLVGGGRGMTRLGPAARQKTKRQRWPQARGYHLWRATMVMKWMAAHAGFDS